MYTFFDTAAICFRILVFRVVINPSATTDSPLLYVKYISMPLLCNHDFNNLLQHSLPWSTHILSVFWPDLSKIFWNDLEIVTSSLSFKRTTQSYNLTLLYLLSNWMSARSEPQILCLKNILGNVFHKPDW